MRLAVLTGAAPHQHDAVGDFAWMLACHLAGDASVSVIAPAVGGGAEPGEHGGAVTLHRVAPGWGPSAIDEIGRLVERLRPDLLLMHFAPTLYGWRGLKPFVALAIRRLGRRLPIVTVAHEFFAPRGGGSPRTAAYASGHRLLFRAVVAGSRKIVVTTPYVLHELQTLLPRRAADFACIPVSSTIEPADGGDAARCAARRELGIEGQLVVSTFAPQLEVMAALLERLFRDIVEMAPEVRFVALGKHGEALRRFVSDARVGSRLLVTGAVESRQASRLLAASDLYVAMAADGASSRRTSLMAGLAHALPTIATDGVLTDAALRDSGAVYLVTDGTAAGDLAGLRRLCGEAAARAALGRAGRAYYDRYFSWDVVTKQYGTVLREALES